MADKPTLRGRLISRRDRSLMKSINGPSKVVTAATSVPSSWTQAAECWAPGWGRNCQKPQNHSRGSNCRQAEGSSSRGDRRDPSSLRFAPGVPPPAPYLGSRAPPSARRSAGSPAGSRSASCRWSAGSSCAPPRRHPGHLAERIPRGDTGHPSAVTAGWDRSHPKWPGERDPAAGSS